MKTLKEKLRDRDDKKWLKEVQSSREITQEILRYGVTQSEIKNIIKLLSLELEDVEIMKAISNILTEKVNEQGATVNILKPGGKTDE